MISFFHKVTQMQSLVSFLNIYDDKKQRALEDTGWLSNSHLPYVPLHTSSNVLQGNMNWNSLRNPLRQTVSRHYTFQCGVFHIMRFPICTSPAASRAAQQSASELAEGQHSREDGCHMCHMPRKFCWAVAPGVENQLQKSESAGGSLRAPWYVVCI